MSRSVSYGSATHDYLFNASAQGLSLQIWTVIGVATTYVLYHLLNYLDVAILSPREFVWNALVVLIPARLIKAMGGQICLEEGTTVSSQMRAAKSEALRSAFRLSNGGVSSIVGLQRGRKGSSDMTESSVPPGLGNWDNSCYQNSVLQGLSSLVSLSDFLKRTEMANQPSSSTTTASLRDTVERLSSCEYNGKHIWTPAKLKSMSSFQQQDAQEYFSKVMDELDKELIKAAATSGKNEGLCDLRRADPRTDLPTDSTNAACGMTNERSGRCVINPLEGLLAQRVACISCGFSEGLSLLPFNCLTVPLGRRQQYDVMECLDEYTSLEEISGVECANCTLRKTQTQLAQMIERPIENVESRAPALSLPPELRLLISERLQHVRTALDEGDFSDATLTKRCLIPKKARVTSTKTRQAVIARAPHALTIHVNRSLFDEYTGAQTKNYAHVDYPRTLNLGAWCLGTSTSQARSERWIMDPTMSMLSGSRSQDVVPGPRYQLRAVVTHYGRHENGHYICYRRHPQRTSWDEQEYGDSTHAHDTQKEQWWRLSDEDVSAVTEAQVLSQPGAFMLFYERIEDLESSYEACQDESVQPEVSTVVEEPAALTMAPKDQLEQVNRDENESTTKAEPKPELLSELQDSQAVRSTAEIPDLQDDQHLTDQPIPLKLTSPKTMRTSNERWSKGNSGFMKGLQTVAAT